VGVYAAAGVVRGGYLVNVRAFRLEVLQQYHHQN
jgi:hypothetical protein